MKKFQITNQIHLAPDTRHSALTLSPVPYAPCPFFSNSLRGAGASPYGPEAAFQLPHSPASVICLLSSVFCLPSSVICLWRHPDIVSDSQFNHIARRRRINGSEGGAGSVIGSVRNTVFKLDMTVAGQNNHDIIF